MFLHPKLIPVETALGIRGKRMEESSEGVNSSMKYLTHCKNLYKCYNVLTLSITIKNKMLLMRNRHGGICL
jgi:hypothetical protein